MFSILQYVVLGMNRTDQFQKKSLLGTLILSSCQYLSVIFDYLTLLKYCRSCSRRVPTVRQINYV